MLKENLIDSMVSQIFKGSEKYVNQIYSPYLDSPKGQQMLSGLASGLGFSNVLSSPAKQKGILGFLSSSGIKVLNPRFLFQPRNLWMLLGIIAAIKKRKNIKNLISGNKNYQKVFQVKDLDSDIMDIGVKPEKLNNPNYDLIYRLKYDVPKSNDKFLDIYIKPLENNLYKVGILDSKEGELIILEKSKSYNKSQVRNKYRQLLGFIIKNSPSKQKLIEKYKSIFSNTFF